VLRELADEIEALMRDHPHHAGDPPRHRPRLPANHAEFREETLPLNDVQLLETDEGAQKSLLLAGVPTGASHQVYEFTLSLDERPIFLESLLNLAQNLEQV
jgi:hypothetical protein